MAPAGLGLYLKLLIVSSPELVGLLLRMNPFCTAFPQDLGRLCMPYRLDQSTAVLQALLFDLNTAIHTEVLPPAC